MNTHASATLINHDRSGGEVTAIPGPQPSAFDVRFRFNRESESSPADAIPARTSEEGSGTARNGAPFKVTLFRLMYTPPPDAGVPVMISPLKLPDEICQFVDADGARSVPLIVADPVMPTLMVVPDPVNTINTFSAVTPGPRSIDELLDIEKLPETLSTKMSEELPLRVMFLLLRLTDPILMTLSPPLPVIVLLLVIDAIVWVAVSATAAL